MPPAEGRPPVAQDHPLYVLVEAQGADPLRDAETFAASLDRALSDGLIRDAAIARSGADARDFRGLRDDVAQMRRGGVPLIGDVSLPIARMARYTADLRAKLLPMVPPDKLWIFGHLGDGNLQIIVQVAPQDVAAARPQVEALVYGLLELSNGAVSAEHGIGLEKKPWLKVGRSEAELARMRILKAALDPKEILNPGKIFEGGSRALQSCQLVDFRPRPISC
jgi:FAD/FMN-containing dehydrogenase